MKSLSSRFWLYAAIASIGLSNNSHAQGEITGISYSSITTTKPLSFNGTKGWFFQNAGDSTIAITQVGVFDNGGDGLSSSHSVGIWGQSLIRQATVPAGGAATLIDGYRYVSIDPIFIPPHTFDRFVIAAYYEAVDADDLFAPVFQSKAADLAINTLGGFAGAGPGLPLPDGYYGPSEFRDGLRFWEPNLRYVIVPEPSSGFMFAMGVEGLLWFLPKRRLGGTWT